MNRSFLFVPGHQPHLIAKALRSGADAVIIDLEDAVPEANKAMARAEAARIGADHSPWVRINAVRTDTAAADLDAVGNLAGGIRIPKVDDPTDIDWVVGRLPAGMPVICAIETARGVLGAAEIAAHPATTLLALGGLDLRRDLAVGDDSPVLSNVRTTLTLAAAAAGKPAPVDSVYPYLDNVDGLRVEAESALAHGFYGKSALSPRQLETIHDVFTPTVAQLDWARSVLEAFDAAGHGPTRSADGEFIDAPVASRARELLKHTNRPDLDQNRRT